jgi:hypothetical protein
MARVLLYAAEVKTSRLSFALLLPALELAVWLLLVPTQTALIYGRLQSGMPATAIRQTASYRMDAAVPGLVLIIPSGQPPPPKFRMFAMALEFGTISNTHIVTSLNLPGTLVEALVSLPVSWPASWHPKGIMLDSWRAIIMPFFCLPFWWFAGRGVDAALGYRRLHWATMLTGSLLCASFLATIVGLRFGLSVDERAEIVDWVFSGLGLWTLAFATFPFVWIRHGLLKRKTALKVAVLQ